MLVQACADTITEGKSPEFDPACALISSRIGFLSPVDTMSFVEWQSVVNACARNESHPLQVIPEAFDS
jgi:hypothetical protein